MVVEDGRAGFVVDDEHAPAAAVGRLGEIDPQDCRRSREERFSVAAVVEGCEAVYRAAAGHPVHAAPAS